MIRLENLKQLNPAYLPKEILSDRLHHSKFHNQTQTLDGISFASTKEAMRYSELKLLQKAKEIFQLTLQQKFELIPPQHGERACSYLADFTYRDKFGNLVVEDTKGLRTKEYIIKRKLMLYIHGIRITEI